MSFTEHASKKYVDERNALLATKAALNAEAEERVRLANIVAQNRRDTYSKDEVNRIVEALRGARFEKVQALPELADADMLAIYLVPRTSPETDNRYDEYIVVTDGEGARSWDKLGSTDIDLSGYATKAEVQVVRESVGALSESVDELQESITSESSRISTLENKVDNPSQVPTEDSDELISSGGVYAALQNKADKETDERFMRTKADIYLSARKGNDANDGLAPERAVKTIGRAYAAAKAAVDAQTLDGTKQVVVAVDEGVYGSVQIINELTAGIAFRAVGARDSTFVVPSNDPGDEANQTPMSCDNGVYPHVFEMEGFTFTGFNGRHHTDMNPNSHQRGIVYGMTLRRCLITGNRPICTKAFVCGTFIDCDITGNATRLTPQNVGGDAPFGGYGAVYNDLAYMTRMFNCHVWDNDFSTFQYFAKKIEAAHCLFENSFAVVSGVGDSYGGHNNTMIAERYTNPYFAYSDTRSKFYKIGVKYFAVIASPAGSTTDPFYTETADYVCVQSAQLTEDKIAADASCPSVRSDGSLDFGYRDSGFGRKKTADALTNGKQDALTFDATPTAGSTNPVTSAGIKTAIDEAIQLADVIDDNLVPVEGPGDSSLFGYGSACQTYVAAQFPGTWTSTTTAQTAYMRNRGAAEAYWQYDTSLFPDQIVFWVEGKGNGEYGAFTRSLIFPSDGVYKIRVTYACGITYKPSMTLGNPYFGVSVNGGETVWTLGVRDPSLLQTAEFTVKAQHGAGTIEIKPRTGEALTSAIVFSGVRVTLIKEVGIEIGDIVAPDADAQTGQAADAKATGDALEALRQGKQNALTAQQLDNIAAVPDKANKSALPYEIKSVPIVSQLRLPASAFPVTWNDTGYHGPGSISQNDQYVITEREGDWCLYNSDGDSIAIFDRATLAYLEPGYQVEGLLFNGNDPVVGASPVLEQVYSGTLYDRAVNKVALTAATSAFSLTLPTQNDGRSRDFLLRIDNTATGAVDATATVVDATLVDAAGTAIASLAAPAGKATAYRLTEAANGTASPSANPVFIVAGANTDQQIARKLDKSAVVAPSSSATTGQAADAKATGDALAGKLDSASAFPEFSTDSTYAVGDVVTHDGGLYVCSTAVETAGPWDAGDWTATTIAALLSRTVPLVVVDDEITTALASGQAIWGDDVNFAVHWANNVPMSWCYSYALNTDEVADGIILCGSDIINFPYGVCLYASGADSDYTAELIRTVSIPVAGTYTIQATIAAGANAGYAPRDFDVLVDSGSTPVIRRARTFAADEVSTITLGTVALGAGEHTIRLRGYRGGGYHAILFAVRGLKVELAAGAQ